MSVSATIAQLATLLATVDPTPQPQPRRVYSDPAEAVNLADFPAIVMGLSTSAPQAFTEEAMGLMRHDYTLALWIFLGIRQTPLAELHSRALPWSVAITTVLSANLTLGYRINQLGPGTFNQPLISFRLGPIPWGMSGSAPLTYWGLTGQLPIVEKYNMTMDAGS